MIKGYRLFQTNFLRSIIIFMLLIHSEPQQEQLARKSLGNPNYASTRHNFEEGW